MIVQILKIYRPRTPLQIKMENYWSFNETIFREHMINILDSEDRSIIIGGRIVLFDDNIY